jgi:hypothetical protein
MINKKKALEFFLIPGVVEKTKFLGESKCTGNAITQGDCCEEKQELRKSAFRSPHPLPRIAYFGFSDRS